MYNRGHAAGKGCCSSLCASLSRPVLLPLMSSALTERPFSKTQLFCSNLPWSVNGKMLRSAFEVRLLPLLRPLPRGPRASAL